MKKLLFIAGMLLSGIAAAQEGGKYESGMTKGLEQFKAAQNVNDLNAVSAFFERIGDAEKDKWLPYYYAAYANYLTGWVDEKLDKDQIGERSLKLIEKAEILETNAELYCLRQMVASLQMMVDPMNRWQTYGAQAATALENAKKADAENPRIYFLEGQSLFYTPELYGGGKKAAKPKYEKAAELYEKYKLPSPFHPDWGKEENAKMLEECTK